MSPDHDWRYVLALGGPRHHSRILLQDEEAVKLPRFRDDAVSERQTTAVENWTDTLAHR